MRIITVHLAIVWSGTKRLAVAQQLKGNVVLPSVGATGAIVGMV
jgi:hypothetical protein